jgi:hypothetical protein
VIFSLTCHARASSGAAPTPLSLARRPPPPPPPPEQERDSHGAAQSQGTLAFPARSRSLAVPANVADLHALLVHDAEVWWRTRLWLGQREGWKIARQRRAERGF